MLDGAFGSVAEAHGRSSLERFARRSLYWRDTVESDVVAAVMQGFA